MKRRTRQQIIFTLATLLWAGCGASASEEVLKTYPDGKTQELARYDGSGSARVMTARIGYYRNGASSFEELYQEGRVSSYTGWWPEGQVKVQRKYNQGSLESERYFDSDGARQITSTEIKDIIAKLADYPGEPATAQDIAVIETSAGSMTFRFYTDLAPLHANNFKRLANFGFYDSTTFHRVMPGFVIQGGDINSRDANRDNDGSGSPGYTILAEFNPRPHVKGSLAMARSANPNSAGSQFYIALGRLAGLDNQYTVFGELLEGMETLESIAASATDSGDNPVYPQRIFRVRVGPAESE